MRVSIPRTARVVVDGGIYRVINRGNGRADVFHMPDSFQAFVNLLLEAKE